METITRSRLFRGFVLFLGVFFTLYHVYFGYYATPGAMELRITHVGLALVLCFLLTPAMAQARNLYVRRIDLMLQFLFALLSLVVMLYVVRDPLGFQMSTGYLSTTDLIMGTILIALVLEATRRSVGGVMAVLAIVLMLHSLYANYFPGIFYGPSVDWSQFIDTNFVQTSGLLGIPVSITAAYVVLFLFFGILLLKTGVGELLMDVATALTGGYAGGPAKACVVSSACMGMMSGSVIANIVTTGSVTIPLMKRSGYEPKLAAGIEAAASTGGVVMPPVMGAAAFILALFAGVPYRDVMLAAVIPSFLYFGSIFCVVHFEARKAGLVAMPKSERPKLWPILKTRGYMLLPLVVITGLLIGGYTPSIAAFYGIASVVVLSSLRRETRLSPRRIMECLEETAHAAVPVVIACAAAGIIIGSVMLSGLGLRISSVILALSGDTLILALLLTAVSAIILGMGMTTTAVYVTLAALIVPALESAGIEPLAAHLFVLYFGVFSYVTPPVALGAFAAAGVAGTNPNATAVAAVRVAAAGFIVPFMFVYGPELLLIGEPIDIVLALLTATIGIFCLAAALSGWLLTRLSWIERAVILAAAITLIFSGWKSDLFGITLALAVFAFQWVKAVRATNSIQTINH